METSQLLYSGSGQFDRGLRNPPQQLAEFILQSIITGWIRDPSQPVLTNQAKDNPEDKETAKYDPEAIAWTKKSIDMAGEKNFTEMIRTASAAIAIDPSYPEAYVSRSWAYLEKGFPEKALADCDRALSLDNNNRGALNNRGLFYLRRGEKDKARDDFMKACDGGLEISCDNYKLITGYRPQEKVDFYMKRAEECFAKKDWDCVIKYTSEIITDNPQSEIALSVRAGAYAYKKLFNEAIKDCDDAIRINPDYSLPYNNKGFALELMGHHREAVLNYEFACNLKMSLACDNLKKLQSGAIK